ncbi:hypothetical protein WR25_10388 [Diploscapter pachys]|uniref:Uncharacterized protein n=1 Tax=Diploscapter pachys TaxID=2018661 RepID=A0A2A2KKF1_9BILA|nr:hypothetical protein WR25_10388 [Diploscapter pachys]
MSFLIIKISDLTLFCLFFKKLSKIKEDSRFGPPSRPRRASYRAAKRPVALYEGSIPIKGNLDEGCLGRVPYASLMAFLMCCLGVILFCIMMTWAFNATAEQTRRVLEITDWPWLDKVQISFVIVTVIMIIFALFFLLLGFAATGATRETMFKNPQSRTGGKCATGAAMIFCVLILIGWLIIISLISMFCISYQIFDDLCGQLTSFTDADCIDLRVFRPLVDTFSYASLNVCGGDAQQFCALSTTAKSWYIVGWVGSGFVILGIALFLSINAANYAHINNACRYVELKEIALESHLPSPPAFAPPSPTHVSGFPDSTASTTLEHYDSRYDSRRKDYRNGFDSASQSQWTKISPPFGEMPSSTSRRAERMSDSVSEYAYGRKPRNGWKH